jgi:hypothetical protein
MKRDKRTDADKRAAAARENGLKGGRPPAWSPVVITAAVKGLRREAERVAPALREELLRFAKAVEEGTLRLRKGKTTAPAAKTPSRLKTMRVMVFLRVTGGRSLRGRNRASEEIAENVLAKFNAKPHDGFDYELTVPYRDDEELDRILSETSSWAHSCPPACHSI